MKGNITACLLSVACFLTIGCAKRVYVPMPTDQRVLLVNEGDKLQRSKVEPKDVSIPWNGVILSEGEHERLLKIEEKFAIFLEQREDQ